METAKKLKEKYEKELKELQEDCKHEDISDWLTEEWAPAHSTGWLVKSCNICWKIIQRKTSCPTCKKEIVLNEDEFKSLGYSDEDENTLRQGYCNKKCFIKWSQGIEIE